MENFFAIMQQDDYRARWDPVKPTRAELIRREQQFYERFGQPAGHGPSVPALLARVAGLFGVLGALAVLAK